MKKEQGEREQVAFFNNIWKKCNDAERLKIIFYSGTRKNFIAVKAKIFKKKKKKKKKAFYPFTQSYRYDVALVIIMLV